MNWTRIVSSFLAILLFSVATASHAEPSNRIALIIGNSDYEQSPPPAGSIRLNRLPNACDDARQVAAALVKIGWSETDIALHCDRTTGQMQTLIGAHLQRFLDEPGSIAFFYFAGHGVQIDDKSFLFGIDAAPNPAAARRHIDGQTGARLFAGSSIELNADFLGQASFVTDAGFSVLIDACRNDILIASLNNDGIRRATAPSPSTEFPGQLVGFSTQKGELASDGAGGIGPYAAALVKFLKGDEHLTQSLLAVSKDVLLTTRKRNPQKPQIPTYRGSSDRPCLVKCKGEVAAVHDRVGLRQYEAGMIREASHQVGGMTKVAYADGGAAPVKRPTGVETIWRGGGTDGVAQRVGLLIDIWFCEGGSDASMRERTARRIGAYAASQAGESLGSVREVRLRRLTVRGNAAPGFRYLNNDLVIGATDTAAALWVKQLQAEGNNGFRVLTTGVAGVLNVFVCQAKPEHAGPARVFWHVPSYRRIDEAQKLKAALDEVEGAFQSVPKVEVVANAPIETDVRFFFEADHIAAFRVADSIQFLTGKPVRVLYMDGLQDQAQPGNVEAWLGKGTADKQQSLPPGLIESIQSQIRAPTSNNARIKKQF